jgi:hypothetical protein
MQGGVDVGVFGGRCFAKMVALTLLPIPRASFEGGIRVYRVHGGL